MFVRRRLPCLKCQTIRMRRGLESPLSRMVNGSAGASASQAKTTNPAGRQELRPTSDWTPISDITAPVVQFVTGKVGCASS